MLYPTAKTTWTVEQAVSYLTPTVSAYWWGYLRYGAPWTKLICLTIALVLSGVPLAFDMASMQPLLRGLHTALSIVFVLTIAVFMVMRSADYRLDENHPKLFKTRKQTKFLMGRLYVTAGVLGGEASVFYLEQAINRLGVYLVDYPTVFDKASTPAGYKRNGSEYLPGDYDEAYRVVIREFLNTWLSTEPNTNIDDNTQLFILRFFPEMVCKYPKLFGKAVLDEIKVGFHGFVSALYALDYEQECVENHIKHYLQGPTAKDVINEALSLPASLM